MFIWKDDETGRSIAQVLLEAADRGVSVDITKEAVGDFFEFHGDFVGTKHSLNPIWQRFWTHPRIRVTYAAHGDHAKVYVIDDEMLLLTGMNIADEYHHKWHDYLVELRGQRFVEQYLMRRHEKAGQHDAELVMNTEEGKSIRPILMKLIEEAEESIILEHCYLSDPDVIDSLVRASKRRVHVTVILPERPDFYYYANMQSLGTLLSEAKNSHLRVHLYQGMIHGKILLVDHTKAFVGSANLMKSSLDEMGEVNVLFTGKYRAIHKLQETLRNDILQCRTLTNIPFMAWMLRWLSFIGL